METGKTSKYLKYAIGEIILVVIGILIALQINNWNTESDNKELEQQYMASLLEDLETDIIAIDDAILGNSQILDGLNDLLDLLAQPSLNEETKRHIYVHSIKYTYWYMNPEFSNVTISQLKNSGDFQIIKNMDITRGIANYSKGLEACEHVKNELVRYFNAMEESQKSFLNLSYAKAALELIEKDLNFMFKPLESFNNLIDNGSYFLQDDQVTIGNYYNNILFYRTTLNNLSVYIKLQKEQAQSLISLITANYEI